LSFSDFFIREQPRVIRFLMNYGLDHSTAQDAAQEVFMAMYSRWESTVASIKNPQAYLFAAARNYATRYRRRYAREELVADFSENELVADEFTEVIAQRVQESDTVRHALEALPPAQRHVLAFLLDGYTPEQIAHQLDMMPATVRSNLRHARMRLKELLAAGAGE